MKIFTLQKISFAVLLVFCLILALIPSALASVSGGDSALVTGTDVAESGTDGSSLPETTHSLVSTDALTTGDGSGEADTSDIVGIVIALLVVLAVILIVVALVPGRRRKGGDGGTKAS